MSQQQAWEAQREREDRGARMAALAFGTAIVASLGLLVVYLNGGNTQLEGLALFVAFTGVGTGLGIWARVILNEPEVTEERPSLRSAQTARDAFEAEYEESLDESRVGRRPFLIKLLAGAGASLGLALLIPLRSLGPSRERELFTTGWKAGELLATAEGEPLRAADLRADQVVTVFPKSAVDRSDKQSMADSQAVLVGTRPDRLEVGSLVAETVAPLVCYSKLCTHAGCPVGLYRAAVGELLCPCHQSTFDVNHGAAVKSGPAGRPLPQLPIGVDADGFLIALGEFSGPVGPSFWDITRETGGVS